jgi:NAD(P)H dehydrogenase (quinone)
MRVLVVYCHPVPDSFCAALRDAAIETLAATGNETRLVDLYAEKFDAALGCEERRGYHDHAPADAALAPHIERIKWAEMMVFVYPTWWYGLPAMLKGWFDRVWATDVAFEMPKQPNGQITPLMTHIEKIAVVTTCGAPWWLSFLMGQPGRKTILRGIRSVCARRCRTLYLAHYLMDASTPASRAAYLEKVRKRLATF